MSQGQGGSWQAVHGGLQSQNLAARGANCLKRQTSTMSREGWKVAISQLRRYIDTLMCNRISRAFGADLWTLVSHLYVRYEAITAHPVGAKHLYRPSTSNEKGQALKHINLFRKS
jgi:hypothetical protein